MHLNIGSPWLTHTRLMKYEHVGGRHGQQALTMAQVAPQLGGQPRWLRVRPNGPRCLSFGRDQRAKMVLQVLTHGWAIQNRLNTHLRQMLGVAYA